MSLLEEVLAASRPQRIRCGVCEFIEERPEGEQAEWDAILAKPLREVGHRAIYRVLTAHGYVGQSENATIKHRNQRHREH